MKLVRLLIIAGMAALPLIVNASGSMGGSAPRAQRSEYTMGKKIYMQKLACDDCMHKGGVKTMEDAKALSMKLDSEVSGLTASERAKVQVYLARRFKL
jgi:hypothetical protein